MPKRRTFRLQANYISVTSLCHILKMTAYERSFLVYAIYFILILICHLLPVYIHHLSDSSYTGSSTVYHIFVKWYAWNHHLSQCKLYVA